MNFFKDIYQALHFFSNGIILQSQSYKKLSKFIVNFHDEINFYNKRLIIKVQNQFYKQKNTRLLQLSRKLIISKLFRMSILQHPKFVMRVDRQQPVPRLVSINDHGSSYSTYNNQSRKQTASKSIRQRTPSKINKKSNLNFYDSRQQPSIGYQNYQTYGQNQSQQHFTSNQFNTNFDNSTMPQSQSIQPSSYYTTLRKQLPVTEPRNYRIEVIQLQKMLEIQKQQKLQLQHIIKQLTLKSQKLQQVNEHIVDRLKEIEKNFVEEKIQQQKQLDQIVKKTVNQVYNDVSNYVANQIQQLTVKLKGQKMTPLLQRKLQLFMESILQINQNTVEMFKFSKKNKPPVQQNIFTQFLQKSMHQKQNFTLPGSRLNEFLTEPKQIANQSFMSKSSLRKNSGSPQQDRRLINNAYVTSYKKKISPSRLFNQSEGKNDNYSNKYSKLLKKLQSVQKTFHQNIQQYPQQQPQNQNQGHISFIDHFKTQHYQNNQKSKNRNQMSHSFMDKKKAYDTVADSRNFNLKQYTPNKRKKIFDGTQHSKSKSKYRNSRHERIHD